ncbi:MAG: LptA/OstA family protein [bacterium]|nr:LptA/OstA family protein [bacterium]
MQKLTIKLFIILILLVSPSIYAFDTSESVPVKIKADKLEYIEEENLIVGEGNVDLSQGETRLQADHMKFYVDTDNINAEGNVSLIQKDNTLKGEALNYNIKKNQGTMEKSSSRIEPWSYTNEEMEQVDKNEFYSSGRSLFTTCDNPSPHYKFRAKEIILYPKKRLVCREVSFMIKDVPTIYFPFYTKKLDDKNRWHYKVGYNKRKGLILRAKYDYFFSNNNSGNYYIDWWQFVGWGTGIDHNFTLFSGKGKGKVFIYFSKVITENPNDDYSYTGPVAEEWKADANYEQMLYESTSFETTYNTIDTTAIDTTAIDTTIIETTIVKETVKENKLTVDSKLDLHYRSNTAYTKEIESASDATKDINSSFDITTVQYPNIVFRVATFQRNLWDDDLKKFKKTEERLPDVSFTLLPTQVGRTTPAINYSLNATYVINYDRGDRRESFDVVKDDLNPDAGNTDTYIVTLATFPSTGTISAFASDNSVNLNINPNSPIVYNIPVEIVFIDYEKKQITVRKLSGPFKLDPRDRITIKYATKFSTQTANLYQKLQTNFEIFKSRLINISFMPAVGYNEDWRDKKSLLDPNQRRVSSFDTQGTLSTRITDYITWQNTHSYKRQWQEIEEDPYKGIVTNTLSTSLTLNSPFNARTIFYRTTITAGIGYDIRRKRKSHYDTTEKKIIIEDEKVPVENRKSKFNDLNINITARPKDYFDLQTVIIYDIYCDSTDITYPVSDTTYPGNVQALRKGKLKSIESTLHYAPATYLDLTYKHNLTYFYPNNSFATVDSLVRVPLTRYWEGSFIGSFRNDNIYVPRMRDFKLDQYKVALKRDLHCWEAEFSIRKQIAKLGIPEDVEFWLTLSLKAFPDKKFGVIGKERYLEVRDQI